MARDGWQRVWVAIRRETYESLVAIAARDESDSPRPITAPMVASRFIERAVEAAGYRERMERKDSGQ